MVETSVNALLLLVIGISVYCDLKYRKIPNFITLPMIILGPVLNVMLDGASGFKNSLVGFSLGLCVFLVPFYLGGMGGGDVKLLAAIGAIKGSPFILRVVFYSVFSGGLMAFIVLVYKRQLLVLLKKWIYMLINVMSFGAVEFSFTEEIQKDKQVLPYGVAIGVGAVAALLIH
jgi:prepilin peptidase CpaA